jgi:hypothetical protein
VKRVVQRLVRSYLPIVMLRAQEDLPCLTAEEQYEPTAVDTVFGNTRVRLARERRGGPRQVACSALKRCSTRSRWTQLSPGPTDASTRPWLAAVEMPAEGGHSTS